MTKRKTVSKRLQLDFTVAHKMPKLKKQPRNAFYFFMAERKQELERRGYRFPRGMKDVADTCHPEYKALSTEQKAKYEKLAKEAKESEKTNYDNKFTTSGESYSNLNRRLQAEQTEKMELKSFVNDVIKCSRPESRIYVVMKAIPACEVNLGRLKEHREYLPLEFAIAAFNIKDGFIACYTSLVNTQTVPCGYASFAKDVADETLLPQPGSPKFDYEAPEAKNYKKIMQQIRLFVETWCDDYPEPGYFLIFGVESNQQLACIKGCLEWLAKNSGDDKRTNEDFLRNVKYYSLSQLLVNLCGVANQLNPNYQNEITQFGLSGSAETMLKMGCYDYKEEITCKYHNKEDYSQKMHLCSKNYIVRRVFLMLEELTPAFQCPLQGRHKINEFSKTPLASHLRDMMPKPKPESTSTTNNSSSPGPSASAVSTNEKYRESSNSGNGSTAHRSSDSDCGRNSDNERDRRGDDRHSRESRNERDRPSRHVSDHHSERDQRRVSGSDRDRGQTRSRYNSEDVGHETPSNSRAYDDRRREHDRPTSVGSSNDVVFEYGHGSHGDLDRNQHSGHAMEVQESTDDFAYERRPKKRSSESDRRADERDRGGWNQDRNREYDSRPLRDLDRGDGPFRNPSPPQSSSSSVYLKPLSYSLSSGNQFEEDIKPVLHDPVLSVPWGAPRREAAPQFNLADDFPSLGPPVGRGRGFRRSMQDEPEARVGHSQSSARASQQQSRGRGGNPSYSNSDSNW